MLEVLWVQGNGTPVQRLVAFKDLRCSYNIHGFKQLNGSEIAARLPQENWWICCLKQKLPSIPLQKRLRSDQIIFAYRRSIRILYSYSKRKKLIKESLKHKFSKKNRESKICFCWIRDSFRVYFRRLLVNELDLSIALFLAACFFRVYYWASLAPAGRRLKTPSLELLRLRLGLKLMHSACAVCAKVTIENIKINESN